MGYGVTPGSFTAFAPSLHTNSFGGNASLQGYYVSNPQIVPAAVVNIANTAQEVAPGNGITFLDPGQIFLHPGGLSFTSADTDPINNAILRFTAPTAGAYSIAGDWETLHFGACQATCRLIHAANR